MNTIDPSNGRDQAAVSKSSPAITAGVICWAIIAVGFIGLKALMQERPEFIGPATSVSRVEMIQDAPWVVTRKASDDVSVIKPSQPESSDVRLDMSGRRDYRGLRTVMDMSGEFRGRYVLTNSADEPLFVLFKCLHPRAAGTDGGSLLAGGLRLQSSVNGTQESGGDAWVWSGTLQPHSGANLEVSYQVASLKGLTYRVGEKSGNPVKQLRVTVQRRDLDSMRFESGDGRQSTGGEIVSWERKEFLSPDYFTATIVETRNLHVSLTQLLEIGPVVCLLFLLAMTAAVLVRQELTAVQMITLATGYALYFPLILYLSAHFSFPVALTIAAVVPGVLMLNYARWLLGPRLGLVGGVVFLALYWVFPTLAAFAGWNRGMVLLCLGVVTLWVLINLQNQALRRKAAVAALLLLLVRPCEAAAGASPGSGDIQIVIPTDLAAKAMEPRREALPPVIAFDPCKYTMRTESNYLRVEVQTAFRGLRAGDNTVPLFNLPVYLLDSRVECSEPNLAGIITTSNRLGLFVQRAGSGTLWLSYRVPISFRDGKASADIPMLTGLSGNVKLETPRDDFEVLSGSLWSRSSTGKITTYDIGVAGEDTLAIESRDQRMAAAAVSTNRVAESAREFYGIGVTRAQNLTVVNSDGSCTHFAEFELPVFQTDEFRLKLPSNARLISVSVNGTEVSSPSVDGQVCRVRLPAREAQQSAHRLSFRIGYPPLRLGFMGTADLALPEVFQTTGTLEWVVALPSGFLAQVISSGLEVQRTAPDLGRFGDYGRVLKGHAQAYLTKDLAPPGPVGMSLKYQQLVPGISEAR